MDRRLDRLTDQIAIGRLIVLNIAHEHVEDCTLIESALADAGIERTDADLTMLLKCYGAIGTEPACALLSVTPLDPKRRR
jgi:hypothetical protein